MIRPISISILIFYFGTAWAQTKIPTKKDALDKFGFTEHFIALEQDTISFYIHQKPNSKPSNLVLYLQGTAPDPLFLIKETKGKFISYRWTVPGDYELLDEDYVYAVIAKTGIPGVFEVGTKRNLSKYHEFNSLDHRVFQADTVINYIADNLFRNLNKVIVYGHSEGAPVAAKLGTINERITHLGFWAGNVLPDFFDFILFNTKGVSEWRLTEDEAFANLDTLVKTFSHIAKNPDDISFTGYDDYTNKRWMSYAEPNINNLIKIDIPLFVQVAGSDESAPFETAYMIPFEFARLGKTNLTFRVCRACDHGFEIKKEDGEIVDQWAKIFKEFMDWTREGSR